MLLGELWSKLKENFSDWEDIEHTGGGIFVIRTNFKDYLGHEVMVTLSNDMVVIMKHKDRKGYINLEEFENNRDIWWEKGAYDLEIIIMELNNEGEIDVKEKVYDVFDQEKIELIKNRFVELTRIIHDI